MRCAQSDGAEVDRRHAKLCGVSERGPERSSPCITAGDDTKAVSSAPHGRSHQALRDGPAFIRRCSAWPAYRAPYSSSPGRLRSRHLQSDRRRPGTGRRALPDVDNTTQGGIACSTGLVIFNLQSSICHGCSSSPPHSPSGASMRSSWACTATMRNTSCSRAPWWTARPTATSAARSLRRPASHSAGRPARAGGRASPAANTAC